MSDEKIQANYENFDNYKEMIDKALEGEISLFERFAESVIHRAKNHHQVTINNLEESRASLVDLKDQVKALKHSIFYHKETLIIDRQTIIQNTEKQVQNQNQNILEFEYKNAQDKVMNFDYLNKALLQSSFDFFNEFKMYYAKDIIDLDELYAFLTDKNKTFEKIIQKYENEVLDFFTTLDNEIYEMNDKIASLMQQKNSQLDKIYNFFQDETNAYIDNQLTFTAETDLNSQEIKKLISDKLKQFKSFKKHLISQEGKIKVILHEEYLALYNKVLQKLLQEKGNIIMNDAGFFDHIDDSLYKLKEQIVFAKNENLGSLGRLIKTYNSAIKYKDIISKSEKKAKNMTYKFLQMKKGVFFEYQKESRKLIFQMEKYYKLYLDILRVDPFLAQIIGDKATKIIKDEVNYLSTLKINKEHKINVNFDIKTLKLNQQINEIESKLIYEVERQIYLQDIDLISNVLDIQTFFIEKKADTALSINHLSAEKYNIFKLDKAINSYLKHDIKVNNLNRKYLNLVTELLIKFIRTNEAYEIELVEALSDIKLALKEYDIAAIHFKTMFDNEKRFLVMQSNRVSDETKIQDNFILTTYENQMRFAEEQVALANDEFKLRVQAIMTAVDEERDYYNDIIDNQSAMSKKRKNDIMDEYQAIIYKQHLLLSDAGDSKATKSLEKDLSKTKVEYDKLIDGSEMTLNENEIINNAKRRLKNLDDHLEEALEEAVNLRDETIDEMQSLYSSAKERYEYFKVYLENKVDPLEPTFFQTLERMQKRYEFKLKTAEAELDFKTKDLLDNYLMVYFKEHPSLDENKLLEFIEQLQSEKNKFSLEYQTEIKEIDDEYQEIISGINTEKERIIAEARRLKENIITQEELEISQKQQELQTLESKYNLQQAQKQNFYESEIENLTNEYNSTLIQSKNYIYNLSQSFEKVLATYKPYVIMTKNNRRIRNILKKTDQQINKKERLELKKLSRRIRRNPLLINK
ncbi:MAG: hypothetical protein AB7U52_02960 [Candidatus Izemoplasmatales bacterium]